MYTGQVTYVVQVTLKTRPCLTGHPVPSDMFLYMFYKLVEFYIDFGTSSTFFTFHFHGFAMNVCIKKIRHDKLSNILLTIIKSIMNH